MAAREFACISEQKLGSRICSTSRSWNKGVGTFERLFLKARQSRNIPAKPGSNGLRPYLHNKKP